MKAAGVSHSVYVSVGSNIDRDENVNQALSALQARYTHLIVSSVYESTAIGFVGDPFLNLVVQFNTTQTLPMLVRSLRKIEEENGRRRGETKFSNRSLDIDILLYDDRIGEFEGIQLPRPEITENAYVLWPLAEIAGNLILPGCDRRIGDLWSDYDKTKQQLSPTPFSWQGNPLPLAAACHPDDNEGSAHR